MDALCFNILYVGISPWLDGELFKYKEVLSTH